MTGFDDLNEAGKESSGTEASEPDPESDSVDQEGQETAATTDPAFPFDESVQAQIYPRRTTHEAFEDFLDIDVKRHLRERDVREETGRELHEAVLQVAMEHPEEIAETVAEQRRE
jgi:hypothetical protein